MNIQKQNIRNMLRVKNMLRGVIVAVSILEYQRGRLSYNEKQHSYYMIAINLAELDKAGISWKIQSDAIKLGCDNDVREKYVSELLKQITL